MKVLRAGAIYAVANVASAAVPFLLLPLLTRVLGPAEYGRVVAFALLVSVCLTVSGLNAHAALGVVWFRRPRETMPATTGTAVALAIGSMLVVAPLAALALYLAPGLGGGLEPVWGAVAAVTAGATVLLQCRLVLWQSQHRAVANAVTQTAASALNVGLSLVLVLALGWGGDGRNAGIAAAAVVMALVALAHFARAREIRWAPRGDELRTLVAFGAPLIVHSMAGVLLATTDRWLVSMRLGAHALGVYGAGAQLGMVMAILADAFVKAYNPWLFEKLASKRPEDRLQAMGAVYAGIPACFVVAAAIGFTLWVASGIVLGPEYRAAGRILPWFMLGGACTGVYLCTSGLFFFSGRTGLLATVTLSSALLGVAATWRLVSAFGVDGAAMGYAATQAILALIATAVARRAFDLPWGRPGAALALWARRTLAASERPSVLDPTSPSDVVRQHS